MRPNLARIVSLTALLYAGAAGAAAAGSEAASPKAESTAPASEFKRPDWDQIANIKQAAEHLGKLQRTRGATGAISFIDACYKTHGLASGYSAPFEACIAQDYLETKVLATVYSRLPPEALTKLKAPSPQKLADAMGRRIVAAFSQYKVPVSYANEFKELVDLHGFPVFMQIIFPNSAAGGVPPEASDLSDPNGGPDGPSGNEEKK